MLEEIKKIHYRNKKRYGSPRIAKELETVDFHASEKHIRKLMKNATLKTLHRQKFRLQPILSITTLSVDNKLNTKFKVNNENEVWASDITYTRAASRWLYLTIIIDLYDRSVIGWFLQQNTSMLRR